MAVALLRQAVDEAGLSDRVGVSSAGTYAVAGGGPSQGSVNALAERGLDISAACRPTTDADN